MNLWQSPWIPVNDGGERREVSLGETLGRAHELEGLATTPSTMEPALLRLLLAIVLDIDGVPRSEDEWGKRWRTGRFDPERLVAYGAEHGERFDLFHPTAPFAQVADLRTAKGETKPLAILDPARPSGNNVPLYSARTDAEATTLSPAEAARWLLHVQAWDTAAIKSGAVGDPKVKGGKTTGNHTGALGALGVVWPAGTTLFETLLLNTPIREDSLLPEDRPHWRRDPVGPSWEIRQPIGLREQFTWLARRVRLVPEQVDDEVVVRSVVVAAGDRMLSVPDDEPHTMWRQVKNPKPDDPPYRPRRHASGRALWLGLDALLAVPVPGDPAGEWRTSSLLAQLGRLQARSVLDRDYPLVVRTCGLEYGNQSAVVENAIADAIPLPIAALRSDEDLRDVLSELATAADGLVQAVDRLDRDLRRALGGDPIPWDSGQRPGTRLLHQLDTLTRRFLAGLQAHPDQVDAGVAAWQETARRAAHDLALELELGVPPTAHAGRAEGTKTINVASAHRTFTWNLNRIFPADIDDGDDQPAATSST